MSASQPTLNRPALNGSLIPAFLRDVRVLQVIGQIVFAVILVGLLSALWTSILSSLAAKNLTPNLAFLQNTAGFDISERPEWYTSQSTFGQAFVVGLINTLRVVGVGLVLTTLLGIVGGIFLLSSNWLIRNITRAVVEVLRNTPLLVQLFFWYFLVFITLLPGLRDAITLPSEGVAGIPIRLGLYLLAYIVLRRLVRPYEVDAPRRVAVMTGLFAALVAIEVGFWLANTQPAWRRVHGSGDLANPAFLLYTLVSLLLIAAAWFSPRELKWRLIGLAGGQFVGGLLFYFGLAPAAALRLELYPAAYISVRGFVLPEVYTTARFTDWLIFITIGIVLAAAMWVYFGRITETTGRPIPRGWYALLSIVGFTVLGWFAAGLEPAPASIPVTQEDGTLTYMSIQQARAADLLTRADEQFYAQQPVLVVLPEPRRNPRGVINGFDSGTTISPEYMALLIGLVVYTAAFIAEIVRAGILAVPRGQIEASRALGLTTSQTLRMVILPQALRVIIPPLGNQYLNLAKNSSLAIAIAYSDLVLVMTSVMNTSGRSVEGITMIMLTYLSISLTIALVINLANRRFRLVTR